VVPDSRPKPRSGLFNFGELSAPAGRSVPNGGPLPDADSSCRSTSSRLKAAGFCRGGYLTKLSCCAGFGRGLFCRTPSARPAGARGTGL